MFSILSISETVFADEDTTEGQAPPTEQPTEGQAPTEEKAPEAPKAKPTKTFSQADVNRFVNDEKKKAQAQTQKVLDELQSIKSKAELTASERHDLDQRLESLQNELLTKEQLAKKEQDRLKKDYDNRFTSLQAEKDTWQQRFTESTIIRSLTDAAAQNDSYSPKQIVAILRQNTRLVDLLGEDGKPTGELIPKVRFNEAGKDGEVMTLELTPQEAVKRMREQDEYLNLFKGEGSGGSGTISRPSGKKPNVAQLAQDPAAYREARKKGQLNF